MARRPTMSVGSAANTATNPAPSSDDADGSEEVTRCICGNEEFVSTPRTQAANANPGLFVQCEKCHVWQHGFCVGFLSEEDIPDEYYCEQCEPSFHNISMRHGILISRYRPVKRPPASRSPRKSRSREAEPAPSAPAPNGEGPHEHTSTPGSMLSNGRVKPDPGADLDEPDRNGGSGRAAAANGGARRKPSTDRPEPQDGSLGNIKLADSQTRGTKDEVPPRPGLRGPHRPAGDGASRKASHEPPSPSLSPHQSRANSEEPSNDSDDKRAGRGDGPADQEIKAKRSRRKNSDEGSAAALNPVRGRMKRRSREEEILQRVLEESAREARELEARRRSEDNGQPYDRADKNDSGEAPDSTVAAEEDDPNGTGYDSSGDENRADAYTRSGKRQRAATNGEAEGDDEDDEDQTAAGADGASRRRKPRQTRAPRARPGRKPGSKNQSTAQRLAEKQAGSVSRRTPNGVKKCRPRIPSPRSTFQEMRRRVATMLEFSGRTQVEMAEEKQSRMEGPFEVASRDGEFQLRLQQLATMGDQNMTKLEDLTRKLLRWEEQFGPK